MEIGENLSEKAKHDLLLLELAKKGNQAAFTELMHRYRDSIYYMMFKMVKNEDDADDLTIEAFGKAFSRLEQYSPGFAFSTWLFKIASNNCIDFIRKKKLNLTSMDVGFDNEKGARYRYDHNSDSLNPEETVIQAQKVKLMRDLVSKLKPRYRYLVELRYFDELSYEEIASVLNLPLGTVKAQLFRARDFLAAMIEKTKDTI